MDAATWRFPATGPGARTRARIKCFATRIAIRNSFAASEGVNVTGGREPSCQRAPTRRRLGVRAHRHADRFRSRSQAVRRRDAARVGNCGGSATRYQGPSYATPCHGLPHGFPQVGADGSGWWPGPECAPAHVDPDAAAKIAIQRRTKPLPVPGRGKLMLVLELRRALAEQLSARGIREGKNLEAIIIEILEAGAP